MSDNFLDENLETFDPFEDNPDSIIDNKTEPSQENITIHKVESNQENDNGSGIKTLFSNSKFKTAAEIIFYVLFAVLFINLVPKYVMERVSVDGSSMNNTLYDKDQLIGEKISVRHDRLQRFDIIYFYPLGNSDTEAFIKRIIGLPGDTVQIIDSVIYINGLPLSEDYAAEPVFEAYNASEPIYLEANEYFVLGDNRNHSSDSRFSSVGTVKLEDIEGRAVFRIWPLKSFGKID